jgi:hypothetical protein
MVALTISFILIGSAIPQENQRDIRRSRIDYVTQRHMIDYYALHAANGPRWVDSALYAVAFGSSWNWEDSSGGNAPGIVDSALIAGDVDTLGTAINAALVLRNNDTVTAYRAAAHDTLWANLDSTYVSAGGIPISRSFTIGHGIFQSGTISMANGDVRDTIDFPIAFTSDSTYAITITPHASGTEVSINPGVRTTAYCEVLKNAGDNRYLDWIAVGY